MPKSKKPLGRPPATASAETRERILQAARNRFGRFGYDKTTNKDIASEARITTGAIYHYFASKQELFAATIEDTSAKVTAAFEEAVEAEGTLIEQLRALVQKAVELHHLDRSLAAFSVIVPIEVQRHEEVRAVLRPSSDGQRRLFERLIAEGVSRGELPKHIDETAVVNMLSATTMGLAMFGALVESADLHAEMVAAFEHLIDGSLFLSPAPNLRRAGSGRVRAG